MNDFTNFSDLEPGDIDAADGEVPMLDDEFDAPTPGSIEEAAMKIDAILGLGQGEAGADNVGSGDNAVAWERGEDIETQANPFNTAQGDAGQGDEDGQGEDPMIAVEIDGEPATVPLSELTDAWSRSGEAEDETNAIKERRGEIDTAFEQANDQLKALVPALRRQFLGEFADATTPQQMQALAASNPARFAEFQARSQALQEAEGYASTLSQYERSRVLETEGEELAKLVPELVDPDGGDALRDDIRAYGVSNGFDDGRIAEAGAAEIAILHKAMKYDQLDKGQVKAARRAKNNKRARPVMTPGHARREDPAAGYRQAMAKLKKTGHVDDAARVIEMML